MRPVIAYDVVRVCLAGVLLLAAGLKGYQLATEPVLGTGLLDSRWFLIAVVEFELFFGLWLLGNIWASRTRRAAIACFAMFTAVSLYKALSVAATCGCFGHVELNAWYTFALDVVAILALVRFRPAGTASSRALLVHAAGVTLVWFSVAVPTATLLLAPYQPALVAGDMDRQAVSVIAVYRRCTDCGWCAGGFSAFARPFRPRRVACRAVSP